MTLDQAWADIEYAKRENPCLTEEGRLAYIISRLCWIAEHMHRKIEATEEQLVRDMDDIHRRLEVLEASNP